MSTRERIVDEALTLFSTKGYAGTTVRDIADAVGIRDASLYKHFPSKRAIFDTCVDDMSDRMGQLGARLGILAGDKDPLSRAPVDLETLRAITREAFLFYLEDPFASRYRRMLELARYDVPELANLYCNLFMDQAVSYLSALIAKNPTAVSRGEDARVVALEYYAVLFFLLCRYDQDEAGRDDALALLDAHVRTFARTYGLVGTD